MNSPGAHLGGKINDDYDEEDEEEEGELNLKVTGKSQSAALPLIGSPI
jgi:hypothetical protein